MNELIQTNGLEPYIVLFCCCLGSVYSAYNIEETFCVKSLNFLLGLTIGILCSISYEVDSLGIMCLLGLITSGSGALIYTMLIAMLPKLVAERITQEIVNIIGSGDNK